MSQVVINTGGNRIVAAGKGGRIQVKADSICQLREGTVVEEGWLQRRVPQGRRAKFVTVCGVAGNLFQAKVLILARAVENHIAFAQAEERCDLRHPGNMHSKVAEHLIGLPRNGMAGNASRLTEEKQGTLLLRDGHGTALAACKSIDRRIGEDQCELEFGNRSSEHRKVDGTAIGHGRK